MRWLTTIRGEWASTGCCSALVRAAWAVCISGGRTVAVKMVHAGLVDAPGFRERFAREVRASQAVSGPGAVPVLAADADAPVPWPASATISGFWLLILVLHGGHILQVREAAGDLLTSGRRPADQLVRRSRDPHDSGRRRCAPCPAHVDFEGLCQHLRIRAAVAP